MSVSLVGDKGKTPDAFLESPNGNTFDRGATDEFGFHAIDVGKIKTILVTLHPTIFGASWFLDRIIVSTDDSENNITCNYYFPFGDWIQKSKPMVTIESQSSDSGTLYEEINYEVTVKTGNVRGAGTDANVFLQMFGDKEGVEKQLENKENNFEKNNIDNFTLISDNLGELKVCFIHL